MQKDDTRLVTCPYCCEEIEIYVELDVSGSYVQDCEVCCNPWTVPRVARRRRDLSSTSAAPMDPSSGIDEAQERLHNAALCLGDL
jgi:hypothetical protein